MLDITSVSIYLKGLVWHPWSVKDIKGTVGV